MREAVWSGDGIARSLAAALLFELLAGIAHGSEPSTAGLAHGTTRGWLEHALVSVGVLIAAMHLARHRRLMRAIGSQEGSVRAGPLPALTILRPAKGLDIGARANVDAWLATRYPGPLRLVAVLDDADDPAFATFREAIDAARARGVDAELVLCGPPPPQRTGKLHAMMEGLARAHGELVGFSDSDTRPPPDLFAQLARELVQRPEAGSVFAPAVIVGDGDLTAGDAGHALLLNTWYGPVAALAAGSRRELPFIMGQAMVVKRAALEAAGGLCCAEGHLVDDMRIGACLAAAGYRNVQSVHRLPIVAGGHSWGAFLRTFRRWLIFSRGGLPSAFVELHVMKGLLWGAGTAGMVASALVSSVPGLVAGVLCAATFVGCELAQYRAFSGGALPPRHAWLAFALPLVGAWTMARAKWGAKVEWRGREYRLDVTARLEKGAPPTHDARRFAVARGMKSTGAEQRL